MKKIIAILTIVLLFSLQLFGQKEIVKKKYELKIKGGIDINLIKEAKPIPLPQWAPPISENFINEVISYDVNSGKETILGKVNDYIDTALNYSSTIGKCVDFDNLNFLNNENNNIKDFTDLSLVSSPDQYPWCVNCKLITFFDTLFGQSSGVLIDSRHVLTAGHCIYHHDGSGWVDSIWVIPAYNNNSLPYGYAKSISLTSFTGWVQNEDANYDMGLIFIDRPIGALTGWFGYGYNNDDNFFLTNTFHNPGYPAEPPYNGQEMYYWYGNYDNVTTYLLYHNTGGYHGQSGSGSYYKDTDNNRYVYAVLSHGETGIYTGYCRMTSNKFNVIQDTKDNHTPSSYDLIPLNIDVSPSSITAGEQLNSMNYVVHNYSTVSFSGIVYVDVYLSENNLITINDILISSHSFNTTIDSKDNVSINVSSPPMIPDTVSTGDYFVGVILQLNDADNSNNAGYSSDPANIYINGINYIQEFNITDKIKFNIYPNPSKGLVYIEFENIGKDGLMIEIMNITGKIIYSKQFENKNIEKIEEIDLSKYSQGIFFVKIQSNDIMKVEKLILY